MLFTFESYRRMLDLARQYGYPIHGIEKFLFNRRDGFVPEGRFIAIRHDVDYFVGRAVVMAALEAEKNIATTYYIRRRFFDDNLQLVKKIAEFGHQIGYHYEEVDTHQKAPNLQVERDAVGFFIGSLLDLDKFGFPIRTVCAHGNPLTDVDNRQLLHLLRDEDYLDRIAFTYDRGAIKEKISNQLIGDASIDVDGNDFDIYIPDTGRFNPRYNLKDHMENCATIGLKSLGDFEKILQGERHRRIYMNLHPDRWSANFVVWLFDLTLDTAKNVAKRFMGKTAFKGRLVGEKALKHHKSISKPSGDESDENQRPRP